jgi:M6 family metalloprotease-like protein
MRVLAAPAANLYFSVEMEDRSVRQVRSRGDEFFNWVEEEAGYAVERGENGRWQYARRELGRWVLSGMMPQQRGVDACRADPPKWERPPASGANLSSGLGTTPAASPSVSLQSVQGPTPVPLLVVLVAFSNRALTYSSSAWSNAVFGMTGKTVNTFYDETSNGRFRYLPAAENEGTTNDGVVRVTLSSSHPNTTTIGDTVRTAVKAALTAADASINYQAYDTNGDGSIENDELQLALVFAGYEAAYNAPPSPRIWAHQWSLYGSVPAPQLDGVYVGSWQGGYALIGEIHYSPDHQATIGTLCHELGHNFDLLDLYDTDNSSDGVGYHCLMGLGNWGKTSGDSYLGQTPVLLCAYQRQILGFSDVQDAAGIGLSYALTQVSDSTDACDILRIVTPNSQQYFLVENRQLTGFDAGLSTAFGVSSGGGLAIWHIDESADDNATDSRRRVDLEEASNASLDAYAGNQGRVTHYFYAGNRTLFNAATSPNSALNGGGASLAAVSNVSASASQMTFSTDAGANPLDSRLAADAQSLAFPWQGGVAQVVFSNAGNTPLTWRVTSEEWCAAWPTNGTLSVGATQQVSVACSTNLVRLVSREGVLNVTGTDALGTPATGSPVTVPLVQAARPADPVTLFSIR